MNVEHQDQEQGHQDQGHQDQGHQVQVQGKCTMYLFRIFTLLFLVSWTVELVRLSAEDHADYVTMQHHTPSHCISSDTPSGVWSIVTNPFSWAYTTMMEAPIKNDCMEFFRKTSRVKLYLPRIPQSLSNVVSQLLFSPFEMFLDKLGDALRRFMDKFNVAERVFGVAILLVLMTMFSGLVLLLFTYRPQHLMVTHAAQSPPMRKYLTRQEKSVKREPVGQDALLSR